MHGEAGRRSDRDRQRQEPRTRLQEEEGEGEGEDGCSRLRFLVGSVSGQRQENHGKFLLVNLAVLVEITAPHDGVLELLQVQRVVVLKEHSTSGLLLTGLASAHGIGV